MSLKDDMLKEKYECSFAFDGWDGKRYFVCREHLIQKAFKLIMEDIEKHSEGGDCIPKCKAKAMIRHRLGVWEE